ncbi:LytR/AlgR family response regulator transcription factor [Spongiimicrobium salis]|uniref:LytR/AlgR family response regulator transcription factor n=1 Tax=Spongiimicrobium salis TaxID=1667022 RepID=UPI00374CB747
MKVLVVEDDELHATEIARYIIDFFKDKAEIIGPFSQSKEALQQIRKNSFDMAVLDIQLQEDRYAGIHIGESLEAFQSIPILFVTGLSDQKILERTKHIKHCNYIHKPYDNATITRALEQTVHEVGMLREQKNVTRISFKAGFRDKYWVKEPPSGHLGLLISDIVLIQSNDKFCEFYMANDEVFQSRETLDREVYQGRLIGYPNFYKLGRKFIINLDHVVKIRGKRIIYPGLKKIPLGISIPDKHIKPLFEALGMDY